MPATYEIKPVTDNRISLAPESEVAEILQNVQTIISTVRGSVPLDRELVLMAVLLICLSIKLKRIYLMTYSNKLNGTNRVPKLVIYHLPPHIMGR